MYAILLYDPYEANRGKTVEALAQRYRVSGCATAAELHAELEARQYDLLFLGVDADADDALGLMGEVYSKHPFLPIIITCRQEKAELIVEAMGKGASDFLAPDVTPARLWLAVDKAIELRDHRNEINYHRHLQDAVYNFDDVIAKSESMKRVLTSLRRFASTDSTILITGNTGTGKSFLSGTVHFNSPRRKKPFVKINCANIPVDLLESELFGHEKGAFTGADKQRIGRFEQASGGTIFLDEIGEMTLGLQTKLLRVLEEKRFERVGGNSTIYSDVRIIAATNKDLVAQVEKGEFREDLYYRINVLPIRLPSLKERQECLLPLAHLLLAKYSKSMRRTISGFSKNVEQRILSYDWPGNIRQLSNAIERAVILEDGNVIHSSSLFLPDVTRSEKEQAEAGQETGAAPTPAMMLASLQDDDFEGDLLARQERRLIIAALEDSLWVQKEAANKLGITPRSLNYRIGKLGITHHHWRRNA